jgi:hypothetical protein
MHSKVVLIVIAGRRRNLEILIPHLLEAREHFDYCELWMNACWDKEDEKYIRSLPKLHPGTFLLKDDGGWSVLGHFSHYVRYYRTLAKDDTIYIKLDDDILWMSTNAIKNLIEARRGAVWPMIIVGNIVNNTFCNVQHQKLGIYRPEVTLTTDYHDPIGHYDKVFVEEMHRILIKKLRVCLSTSDYNFKDCVAPLGNRVPNHVYAFYGKDVLWKDDDEEEISIVGRRETRPTLITGDALFSHYAYSGQIDFLDRTDIRALYSEFIPGKSYSER